MKKFFATLLIVGNLFLMSVVNAETQIYTGTGEYRMGDSETPKAAERGAKEKAIRNALERAGVFVSSRSRVEDSQLVEDVITSRTGTILKVVDTKTVWDGFLVRVTVQVEIDADDLNRRLQNVDEKVSPLPVVDNIALSKQKVDEAIKLCRENNFREAIDILNKALRLDKNNVRAYEKLGWAYRELNDYDKAIFYCTKAIEVDPNHKWTYNNLAGIYYKLKDYEKAISYCNETIKLDPNIPTPYHWRGLGRVGKV